MKTTWVALLVLLAPAARASETNHMAGTIPAKMKAPGPVFSAVWLTGVDPKEAAGGPFVYLFSSDKAITCADAQKAPSRKNTLVMEIVIGATKPTELAVHEDPPGAGFVYATFLKSKDGFRRETPATSGSVSLKEYHPGKNVTGTFHLSHKSFDVKGSFNAVFCKSPKEI